jgi:hypothetical protein
MHFLKRNKLFVCLSMIVVFITSCATYYQKNESFMNAVYAGKLDDANKLIADAGKKVKKKDILLYYMNRGTLFWMRGDLDSSNAYFQKADFYIEDFKKNYASKALSFVTNPKIEPYGGEGFEQIMVHYYTTLNYAQKGDLDAALVECKRMQNKLQKITDFYNGKNKYKRDAFAHNLMGMIYDAQRDYNNAFIAYRNALEIYEEDYIKMLETSTPEQLKKDLIRTAHLIGFYEEQRQYEERFKLKYEAEDKNNGTLLFFWNNGLGPIKDQNTITFAIIPAGGGYVNFVNTELGLIIPFYVGDDDQRNGLSGLKFIRVAFPKYISRVPLYNNAIGTVDSTNITANFNMGENIDAIAYRSLEDRRFKELSEALLRLALKQLAAAQVSKENDALGAALSLANAITEQADTRNWQLLPYSINYSRVSVPTGTINFTLKTSGSSGANETIPFHFNVRKGQTTIAIFQSLQFTGYK